VKEKREKQAASNPPSEVKDNQPANIQIGSQPAEKGGKKKKKGCC
jgi:hypothetical protein